jgi:hypothetical protein
VTAPGRNGSCAVAQTGNPRERLAQAIVHKVKLKTGAVICLGKSALTTGYIFYLRIIHQFNRSPLKCDVEIGYKEKKSSNFLPLPPPGTYVEGRIKQTLGIPEPLSSYPTNRQFRSAAAYIEGSRATTASVYCYFGGISPLLN